jgi:UDP:flavonoid glycosyltransferase YjiC (YdhE family)
MEAMLAPRCAERGLTRAGRVALVDPWPAALQPPGWSPAADRFPIRPTAYAGTAPPAPIPASAGPRVLVTLGTVLQDGAMLDALVDAVAALEGVEVLATIPPGVEHPVGETRPGVRFVGFVPMARLLAADVAVVVAAGGAGTVLAAMGHGIPMVLWPKGAEKPLNADRVAAAGAGLVIDAPARAAGAVHEVLTDPSYATAAGRVATQIREAPDAAQVWSRLRRKLAG